MTWSKTLGSGLALLAIACSCDGGPFVALPPTGGAAGRSETLSATGGHSGTAAERYSAPNPSTGEAGSAEAAGAPGLAGSAGIALNAGSAGLDGRSGAAGAGPGGSGGVAETPAEAGMAGLAGLPSMPGGAAGTEQAAGGVIQTGGAPATGGAEATGGAPATGGSCPTDCARRCDQIPNDCGGVTDCGGCSPWEWCDNTHCRSYIAGPEACFATVEECNAVFAHCCCLWTPVLLDALSGEWEECVYLCCDYDTVYKTGGCEPPDSDA